MSILKEKDLVFVDKGEYYSEDSDIKNVCLYVAGKSKKKPRKVRYVNGRGVSKDPKKAAKWMIMLQEHLGKDNGRRAYQFVLSFPEWIDDANYVKLAAEAIATMFYEKHQVYYGVHEDKENLHVHFVVNAVSYVDGKKLHMSKSEFQEWKRRIREEAVEIFYNN